MARMNWNASGERYYENGVDRGVLYVDGLGVAWTGLISVAEAPSGGGPRPYYLDGIKYLNIAAAEEFVATVNAFNAPAEFGVCDGIATVHNGLFATQQPRKPFGMSYRTLVGNELNQDAGYKIHLVYNALAAPSERPNSTINDSPEPGAFSWGITTLPPAITGFKPTAHFVVDTRYADSLAVAELEDILYGSEEADAIQPTVAELVALFVP